MKGLKNKVEIVRYKKEQYLDNELDMSLLNKNHIVIGATDYTLCGMATDEYNKTIRQGKVTCLMCLAHIKEILKLFGTSNDEIKKSKQEGIRIGMGKKYPRMESNLYLLKYLGYNLKESIDILTKASAKQKEEIKKLKGVKK